MAKLTLEIPDSEYKRFLDGIGECQNYQETLEDGTVNPETKESFCNGQIVQMITDMVLKGEKKKGEEDANDKLNKVAPTITLV